jgi:truncated hemoglobin YjbI
MVLPPDASPSEVFQASLDRCVADPSFLARFYHRFQATNAQAAARFAHVDMARQERVLRASLYMILRAAQGGEDGLQHLAEIASSHSKQGHDIGPAEYEHWLASLLEAVRECDPDCSDTTLSAWRACIQPCVDVMVARYEALK